MTPSTRNVGKGDKVRHREKCSQYLASTSLPLYYCNHLSPAPLPHLLLLSTGHPQLDYQVGRHAGEVVDRTSESTESIARCQAVQLKLRQDRLSGPSIVVDTADSPLAVSTSWIEKLCLLSSSQYISSLLRWGLSDQRTSKGYGDYPQSIT